MADQQLDRESEQRYAESSQRSRDRPIGDPYVEEHTPMNLRTLVIPVSLTLVGMVGCSEQAEPAPEADAAMQAAGTEAQAAAPAEKTAADICRTIAEAAKAKDIDTIIGASVAGAGEALADEAAKTSVLVALADVSCGEPVIAADDANKAIVMVTAGEVSRELPFSKGADGWRFEPALFLEKEAQKAAAAADAGNKGKKGKKGAKKGKKGKKAKKAS